MPSGPGVRYPTSPLKPTPSTHSHPLCHRHWLYSQFQTSGIPARQCDCEVLVSICVVLARSIGLRLQGVPCGIRCIATPDALAVLSLLPGRFFESFELVTGLMRAGSPALVVLYLASSLGRFPHIISHQSHPTRSRDLHHGTRTCSPPVHPGYHSHCTPYAYRYHCCLHEPTKT
jgi:hypothetical protein